MVFLVADPFQFLALQLLLLVLNIVFVGIPSNIHIGSKQHCENQPIDAHYIGGKKNNSESKEGWMTDMRVEIP